MTARTDTRHPIAPLRDDSRNGPNAPFRDLPDNSRQCRVSDPKPRSRQWPRNAIQPAGIYRPVVPKPTRPGRCERKELIPPASKVDGGTALRLARPLDRRVMPTTLSAPSTRQQSLAQRCAVRNRSAGRSRRTSSRCRCRLAAWRARFICHSWSSPGAREPSTSVRSIAGDVEAGRWIAHSSFFRLWAGSARATGSGAARRAISISARRMSFATELPKPIPEAASSLPWGER